MNASDTAPLLPMVRELGRRIRDGVLAAFKRHGSEALAAVAGDQGGDTIFAVDKIGEALLFELLEPAAAEVGGIVLVAEGLASGAEVLPLGTPAEAARWRLIVDPIDGTRGLMYQKRSAWVLAGLAPNRGPATRLADIVLASQTEIPLLKQYLADELWAVRGHGAHAERVNLLTAERHPLELRPSQAPTILNGYAMLSRFFPGARDVLAAIDEEVVRAALGPMPAGRAACFEEQYASTGGQLYELIVGHDRFNADLRPLLLSLLLERGEPGGLCCHPYDVAAVLIATEAGVLISAPDGSALDLPLDLESPVAWVGYANAALRATLEPALQAALRRRGLLPA